MSNGTTGWITVLLRLPVFDNPDAAGYRASIEDDKFSGHGGRTRPPLRRRHALHLSPRPAARVLVGSRRCRSRRAGTDRGGWARHDGIARLAASLRARLAAGPVPADGHLSEIWWFGRAPDRQVRGR